MNTITILVKQPGEAAKPHTIENTLKALQAIVKGYIEPITLDDETCLLVNEEGLINGMDYNCHVYGMGLYGPIIMLGVSGEEFTSVTAAGKELARLFGWLEEEA